MLAITGTLRLAASKSSSPISWPARRAIARMWITALGCSTNAVIHILAMARRAGHDIGLEDFDAASRKVPVIANIRPSGDTYLMEDFYYAGGMPALLSRLREWLHLDARSIT